MPETGVKAAIEAAGGAGEAPRAQEDLFPAAPAAPVAAAGELQRGPGRPAGARNKRTLEWQRWFEQTGKMPLEFLAETFRADTMQLAAKLGCEPLEALKVQRAAAEAVLPYVEQKLPLAVEDVSEGKRPIIMVGRLSDGQRDLAQQRFGLRLAGGDGRMQQNQQVIDVQPAASDAQASDVQPNALTNKANDECEP